MKIPLVLSLLIWLPVAAGLVILVLYRMPKQLLSFMAVLASLTTLGLSYYLFKGFDPTIAKMQFTEFYAWSPTLGINYALGIDGLSLTLCALTCFMTFLVIIGSRVSVKKKYASYLSAFLIMQGLICGIFFSLDVVLFYIFFEAMLIPMFMIIGIWGGKNKKYAAIKFFLYTFFGSIFFLVSILYLHFKALSSGFPLGFSFMLDLLSSLKLSPVEQSWLFWGMLIAFAVKVPMWPVHTWLPDAHTEAPTGGSVILAAITLKIGGYGILRFLLPIVPDACAKFSDIIICLSLVAIVYIGLVALVQKDMKRLIAYSSIAHMGFVTLGIFLIFALGDARESAVLGLEGAIIQMLSHGLISGALFFSIGVLYDRVGSRNIEDYGGVAKSMPMFAAFFMIFALGNSGLPGTSGFVGELFVILTSFKVSIIYAALAATTLILGAAYTLWLYRRVMFGPIQHMHVTQLKALSLHEISILSVLAGLIILFGVWPAPVLDLLHTSSQHMVTLAFK